MSYEATFIEMIFFIGVAWVWGVHYGRNHPHQVPRAPRMTEVARQGPYRSTAVQDQRHADKAARAEAASGLLNLGWAKVDTTQAVTSAQGRLEGRGEAVTTEALLREVLTVTGNRKLNKLGG